MEKIYAECYELKEKYIEEKKREFPDYYFKYSEGERYLRPDVFDGLMKDADDYFQQCLKERLK